MAVSDTVYNILISGTPFNPGLPDPLSWFVLAQTLYESNEYTSRVFRIDNNLNGYKWVDSRYQTGPGLISPEGDPYGHYGNYQDSARELVDWIYRRVHKGVFPADLRTITTPEQYSALLKKAKYYTDDEKKYTAGLKRYLTGNYETASMGGILVLIAIGWFLYPKLKKAI